MRQSTLAFASSGQAEHSSSAKRTETAQPVAVEASAPTAQSPHAVKDPASDSTSSTAPTKALPPAKTKSTKIHPLFAPRAKKVAPVNAEGPPRAETASSSRSAEVQPVPSSPKTTMSKSLDPPVALTNNAQLPSKPPSDVVIVDDDDENDSDDEVRIVGDNIGVAVSSKEARPAAAPLKLTGARSIAKKQGPAHSFFQARKTSASRDGAPGGSLPAGFVRMVRRQADWPTRDNVHVQPDIDEISHGIIGRSTSRAGIENAFLAGRQSASVNSGKGKGKASDQGSLDAERQLLSASINAPLCGLASSTIAQIQAMLPHPHRGTSNDVIGQYVQSEIDLNCIRDAEGRLPAAIQRALDAALLSEHAQTKPRAHVHSDLWSDRWRPTRAADVLGNEAQATYLRDWIWKLKIAPPPARAAAQEDESKANTKKRKRGRLANHHMPRSRQRIQKRAVKSRRRQDSDIDDFIVDDDEDDSDEVDDFDSDEDTDERYFDRFRPKADIVSEAEDEASRADSLERAFGGQGTLSDTSFGTCTTVEAMAVDRSAVVPTPAPPTPIFEKSTRLTNCIVLAGPVGSGKTAAVFACAAELDYDVFELYPGMGKRSGKEIVAAVGNLANNNHMVSKGGHGGGAFFRKSQSATSTRTSKESEPKVAQNDGVHQSVILIDQADILFEEDKGFWHAVVELIGSSARPVILTCNDLAEIPLYDLPVQETLFFAAPSPPLSIPYLQLVALNEGHLLSRTSVTKLYKSTSATFHSLTDTTAPQLRPGRLDGPTHPFFEPSTPERSPLFCADETLQPTIQANAFDLRHALSNLQFWCQWAVGTQRCAALPDNVGQLDWNSRGDQIWSKDSLRGSDFDQVAVDTGAEQVQDTESEATADMLQAMASTAAARSFADSALAQSFHRQAWAYEPEDRQGTAERQHQDSSKQLLRMRVEEDSQVLPIFGRETELQDYIYATSTDRTRAEFQSQPRLAATLAGQFDHIRAELQRLRNSRLLLTVLAPLPVLLDQALPRPSCSTEYWPYVRQMVELDDAAQKVHDAEVMKMKADEAKNDDGSHHRFRRGPARATRNSKRSAWEDIRFYRQLDLDEQTLRAVRQFSLPL